MLDQDNHRTWHILFWVWATFFLFGAVAVPVPGVNEPHYLCKAKHFWQPDWCSNDFFLASPNAHTVFYATIGCLTNWMSLEQSAWIGRILAMLVLAWGWTRCLSRLFLTPAAPLWCAWIFLVLSACGNFSGEWLVGGVEGKVFSYGLLLAAFGEVLRDRWRLAGTWAGLAVSFHPVVGIWGLFAFGASCAMTVVKDRLTRSSRERQRPVPDSSRPNIDRNTLDNITNRPAMSTLLQSLAILIVLALPGLLPVFQLLTEKVDPDTRYAANYIQVYFRLAHHLDPMVFSKRDLTLTTGREFMLPFEQLFIFSTNPYVRYATLLTIWLSSFWWGGRTNSKRAFDGVVLWSVVFACAGILIGYGPRPANLMPFFETRMHLLKFYPFRLADLLVPIAVAVSLVSILERTAFNVRLSETGRFPFSTSHAILLCALLAGMWQANATRETNRFATVDRADWLNVCEWINSNVPQDAVVQAPTNGWAFKWFAQRAEYVAYKDCPQDAAGIVEWNRRLTFLNKWYEKKYEDKIYSASELKELRQETGITHLLTDHLGPIDLEPIYQNTTFRLYDIRNHR